MKTELQNRLKFCDVANSRFVFWPWYSSVFICLNFSSYKLDFFICQIFRVINLIFLFLFKNELPTGLPCCSNWNIFLFLENLLNLVNVTLFRENFINLNILQSYKFVKPMRNSEICFSKNFSTRKSQVGNSKIKIKTRLLS